MPPMDIRPNVEKPFYERSILGDTAHVQNVLPIILLTMNGRSFSKYKNIVFKYNIVLYFTILFFLILYIYLGQVNVVEELGIPLEHPLGAEPPRNC